MFYWLHTDSLKKAHCSTVITDYVVRTSDFGLEFCIIGIIDLHSVHHLQMINCTSPITTPNLFLHLSLLCPGSISSVSVWTMVHMCSCSSIESPAITSSACRYTVYEDSLSSSLLLCNLELWAFLNFFICLGLILLPLLKPSTQDNAPRRRARIKRQRILVNGGKIILKENKS